MGPVSHRRGLLDLAEHQAYVKGIAEAADGLERAHLVLADALSRVQHGFTGFRGEGA